MSPSSKRWWIVAAMALPLFLLSIDFYGITVALPSIGADLEAGTTGLQWTVNAFNLALAAPLIAFGRLGDVIGRRRTMVAGIVLFGVGSAICGLAPNIGTLIAGRCVQGLAVALFSTGPLSIVSNAFAPGERAAAFGICTAVGACGSAVGPLVGGVLTELLSWRWLFLVNLPVGALTMLLILMIVPESRDEKADGRFDVMGMTTVTGALTALVFGLQLGDDWGWTSWPVMGSLVASVVLFAMFVVIEQRRPNPLVDLALFRDRGFVDAQMVAVLGNFGFSAIIFFTTLYLQHVLQLEPISSGLVLLAFSASFVLTLPATGSLMAVLSGRMAMTLGMALMVVAFLLFEPIVTGGGLPWVLLALVIAGVGQGFAFNASTTVTMNAVPDARAGAASGILNGARQLGSVLGIAVTGAVFQGVESDRLLNALQPSLALEAHYRQVVSSLLSGSIEARRTIVELAQVEGRPDDASWVAFVDGSVWSAFSTALQSSMLLCAVVSALGVAVTIRLRSGGMPGRAAAVAGN